MELNIHILIPFSGVGKTAFIRASSQWAEKILRMPGQDPNCPSVILCAPTGKAASLIGMYIHALVRISKL